MTANWLIVATAERMRHRKVGGEFREVTKQAITFHLNKWESYNRDLYMTWF